MDRKYGHRGYRDAEKQDKKDKSHRDRKPPSGGPRGADHSGAQFECTQPVKERITPKDGKNSCTFYEFRMTVEKDTAPTSYSQPNANGAAPPGPPRHTDARQAFEDLFKK